MLEPRQVGALQQRLVHGDGPRHLSLLTVQVAKDHLNFERIGVRAGRGRELFDGLINLMLRQEVQAEHVVRRFAQPPAIDPPAIA